MNYRNLLIAHAVYYQGDWQKIVEAFYKKNFLPESEAEALLKTVKSNVLTLFDKDYPSYLKELYMPPIVLFYYGDISLLNEPKNCLAIVGTRNPSTKGIKHTKDIIKGLKKNLIVVSGLAKGIDAVAHSACMARGLRTVAVLGCGIENVYPIENEALYKRFKRSKRDLIISEYPGMTPPDQIHFPIRNRLIVQFSSSVLVTESTIRSGTMITANHAVNYNRHVLCVPSENFGESGCNNLIREGAILVESAEHVNEFYE